MKYKIVMLVFVVTLAGCVTDAPETGMMHGMHMPPVVSEEQFIVEMIPHHQEAVDTSLVVESSTENEELKRLTREIIDAQTAEIEIMNAWLNDWYEGGYEPEYKNMMGDLESVSGTERDVLYIKGMIMHHMMAVKMANQVLSLEPREEVAQFAMGVIEVQTREIKQLQMMLEEY